MTGMSHPGVSPGQSPQPLRPQDLFDEAANGAAVALSMKVLRVIPRTTTAGMPWAIVDGVWRAHHLRLVAFPTVWASVQKKPQPGDTAIAHGTLSRREGRTVVRVLHLARMRPVQH